MHLTLVRLIRYWFFLVFLACSQHGKAQLVITNQGGTAQDIVDAMIGFGLNVTNATINCPSNSYGTFTNGQTTCAAIPTGVLLSTGNLNSIGLPAGIQDYSPNFSEQMDGNGPFGTSCNDPQLNSLEPLAQYDCCILEFDVIPSCDKLLIRFVFGSEEYPEWVSAGYNDAFGFFVTGTNPFGANYNNTNVATLPDNTTIVSIDNVNPTTNAAFYINNVACTNIALDGITTVLVREIDVVPCETYHFKLAIADAGDPIYDSGVFIDFLECENAIEPVSSTTPAGCVGDDGTASVSLSGGTPPYTVSWNTTPVQTGTTATGLAPGTYVVSIDDDGPCTDPVTDTVVVISDASVPSLTINNESICEGATVTLTATPSAGGGTYDWSTGESSSSIDVTPSSTTTYTCDYDLSGCTTTESTTVTVLTATSGTDTQTACVSYSWIDGNTYNASNNSATFNIVGGAANGCDSLVTLDLTINNPTTGTDTQSTCGPYTWIDGNTYNSSNNSATYTFSGGASNGCDSVVTLDLTINNTVNGTDVLYSCDPVTWIDGNTYSSSNNSATFTIAGGASNGCDSVVTLDLTINNTVNGTDVLSSCDPVTWIDGNTYNSSNNSATYTISGGASNGCDSTVTLDLTINNPTVGTDTQSACGSYTWIDGNTYNSSNNSATYTIAGGASNGCDSVVTLDLTINNTVNGIDVLSSCDPVTWIDGNTYNSSNNSATFTIAGGASNGCDSLVTLDLTINNPTAGTDTQTACETYTWIDGNTYTSSNNSATFTIAGGASNGCDSLVTLDLTINNPTAGTDTQTACETYTWIDGNTYSSSNNSATFTIAGGASNGCDSTITLDLTIDLLETPTFAQQPPICVGDNFTLSNISNEGITGSWSPAIDNTQTTAYTFTPDVGQCSNGQTMVVSVGPPETPTFAIMGPYCQTGNVDILPSTSLEGFTGTWSPNTIDNSTTGIFSSTFTPDVGLCATLATIDITITDEPSITANALDSILCVGESAILFASDISGGELVESFTMTFGNAFNYTTTNTNLPGNYYVSVSGIYSGNGPCESRDAYYWFEDGCIPTVPPLQQTNWQWNGANPSTQSIPPFAYNPNHEYNFFFTGGVPQTYSFTELNPSWYGDNSGSLLFSIYYLGNITWSTGSTQVGDTVIPPAGTNTYTVSIDFGNGCIDTDDVDVIVNPLDSPTFNPVPPICVGDEIILPEISLEGFTGTWSPAIDNTQTTEYTFTPDAGQCASTQALTVTVGPPSTPTFDLIDPVCSGDNINLPLVSLEGFTGTWTPPVNNTATTTYTFTPDENQCALVTDLIVEVLENPIISADPQTVCVGDEVILSGSGAGIGGSYSWDNGVIDGESFVVNGTMTYTVTGTDVNGCTGVATVLITGLPVPVSAFSASPESGGVPLDVIFTNNSQNATNYEWDFGNDQNAIVNDESAQNSTYEDFGVYTVWLHAYNGICVDSASLIITTTVEPWIFVPNVFTPNADGSNETFLVSTENMQSIRLVIVNRWGNLMATIESLDVGWDGTTPSGFEAKEGVYFYKYSAIGLDGSEWEGHGFLTLIR